MMNCEYEEELSVAEIERNLETCLDDSEWQWEFDHEEKVVYISPHPDVYRYEADGSFDFSYSPDYEDAESRAPMGLPGTYQIVWS